MASPQQRPFPVHRLGEDRGAASDPADHVLFGHVDILKQQLPDGRSAQAHLFEGLADAESRRIARHEKGGDPAVIALGRSEEHTSELQSLMRISYAGFCLKKKKKKTKIQ